MSGGGGSRRRFLSALAALAAISREARARILIGSAAPPAQTIAGVAVSPTTFSAGVPNGVVGAVSVTMAPPSPPFSGTLSTSGANSGGFQLSSTSLPANLLQSGGGTAAGTYNDETITATQVGISNSPQSTTPTLVGSTLVELGSGYTFVNNGAAGSNVPVMFGFGVARGDMAPGNTWVFKDDLGNTLTAQVDQVSTRTALPGATDTPGVLHFVGSTQLASFAAAATRTIHVYKQVGSYAPGTGLPTSALTLAHTLQVKFKNVKDCNGATIGSGNFTSDLNSAIALGARTFAGGYDKTYDGAVCTVLEVLSRFTDDVGGATEPHLVAIWYVIMWQTTPGSGTLGVVQVAVQVGLPPINTTTGSVSLHWGDLSVVDGATTLRSYSNPTTFAPSDVTVSPAGTFGVGTITNTDGIQMAEGITFSSTGTLPAGLTAGQLYFALEYTSNITGLPTAYSVTKNRGVDGAPGDFISLTNQGSGTHTVTRRSAINYRGAVWLFADDQGKPIVLNPTGAILYPALTTAQKTYFQKSGLIAPYDFAKAGGAPNPYLAVTGTACGPNYRHGSFGAQGTNIGSGGVHPGLGPAAAWTVAWWLTQNTASLDVVRGTALSQASALVAFVLNEATGYMPAVDNGPDRVGGSYAKLGAPFPNLCWLGPGGSQISTGFSNPITPAGIAVPSFYLDGVAYGGDEGKDHWPALGAATLYVVEGSPWYLRTAQYDANYGLIMTWNANAPNTRLWTIGTTTYYGKVVFTAQQPRSSAWAMRDIIYAAVLGADNDPQRAYFWNEFRENVDAFHDIAFAYFGATDPNWPALGLFDAQDVIQELFMQTYAMGTWAMAHMLTHYNSTFTAATTANLRDYNTKLLAGVWTVAPFPNYWAPVESIGPYQPSADNTSVLPTVTPGHPPAFTSLNQITNFNCYIGASVDASGVVTPAPPPGNPIGGGAPSMGGGQITNGDVFVPTSYFAPPNAFTLFGPGPLYVINASNPSGTCQLAASPGGPPLVPAGLPAACDFAWRPQFTQPAPATWHGQNTAPGGYSTNAKFGLGMMTVAGSTDSNLPAALANAEARLNATFGPTGDLSWLTWAIDPTFTVP